MRFSPILLSVSLLFACVSPSLAAKRGHGAKHSSHIPAKHAAKKQAQAKHLARLAAKEKSAWRAHLAKLRELPKKKRVAMKRHDKRFKRETVAEHQHALRLQAHEAHVAVHLAHVRAAQQAANRAHQSRLAARHHHAVAVARAHPSIVIRHAHSVERRQVHVAHKFMLVATAHNARLAAHNARLYERQTRIAHAEALRNQMLAQRQAAHLANARQQEAARQQRLTRQAAIHQAHAHAYENRLVLKQQAHNQRLARMLAAHNARLANLRAIQNAHQAAQNAHHVAMNGDGSGGKSIRFWQTVAAHVPVKVIAVDLNDNNVKVSAVMARRGSGTAEPFRQMIERANPNVAVTGTFFSLDNLQPIGDIVIDGSLIHFGGMGTALCITPENRATMVTCEWGRHHDWSPYDFVCACGPRLLEHGRIMLDPHAERFKDRHMLSPNSRIAVGITPGNTLVFAMTHKPIYLGRLAQVMQSLGASEAMNLDAGTSTGFYYNGTTMAHPGRQLTNMIVVYGRRDRYQQALAELVPSTYHRANAHYAPAPPRGRVLQVLDPMNGNYQLQPIRH